MLSVVPGGGLAGRVLGLGAHTASVTAHCKAKAECFFHFSLHSKSTNLFRFLLVVKAGSHVDLL